MVIAPQVAQREADIERQCAPVVGNLLAYCPVQTDRFQEHHRVRIADRREQQAVGARRRGGAHDADAGNMAEHRLGAFRMMLGGVDSAAVRCSNHHRTGQPAAGAIAHAREVIDDLIERRIKKAHELDFSDGLQAMRGHADGHARDGRFGERRVLHTILAEAFLQPCGGPEHAAVDADVLADHHDGIVMPHFPAMRQRDGFHHGDCRQGSQ
jgi:hypothetical protein